MARVQSKKDMEEDGARLLDEHYIMEAYMPNYVFGV